MALIDPELAALIRALPEEARAMIYLVIEDVAFGEMDVNEGLEFLEAIFNEYHDKLIQ